MGAPRRWFRLDVGWDDSEWIGGLSPAAQLAWVKLIGYIKRDGAKGCVKALSPAALARKFNIPEIDAQAMLEAAYADQALVLAEGAWMIANWDFYQEPDRTAADRARKYRAEKSRLSPLRRDTRDVTAVTVPNGVTRRVTETETETEQIQITDVAPNGAPTGNGNGKKKQPSSSWLVPYVAEWAKVMGGDPVIGKMLVLAKVREKYGDARAIPAWRRYLIAHEPLKERKYASAQNFASAPAQWLQEPKSDYPWGGYPE